MTKKLKISIVNRGDGQYAAYAGHNDDPEYTGKVFAAGIKSANALRQILKLDNDTLEAALTLLSKVEHRRATERPTAEAIALLLNQPDMEYETAPFLKAILDARKNGTEIVTDDQLVGKEIDLFDQEQRAERRKKLSDRGL